MTTSQASQAYDAIMKALERANHNEYLVQRHQHVKKGRKPSTMKYHPPEYVADLIQASSDVLGGRISPDAAMSMLHEHDVLKARTRRSC